MNESAEPTKDRKITLGDICEALGAEVICGGDKLDEEVSTACGCDLMSDVLAFTQPGSVLLTGLTNQQVVRTAEMIDLKAIIFVRKKQPDQKTLQLAESKGMPVLLSPYPLYESCGRLYSIGVKGCNGSSLQERRAARESRRNEMNDSGEASCGAIKWGD
jgi:predicted transcriptional regulator